MEKGVNSSGWNVSVLGDTTYNRNVNNLKPYTYYVFSIGARTSAGWGEFSEEKTNQTLEGRMYTSKYTFKCYGLTICFQYTYLQACNDWMTKSTERILFFVILVYNY